MTRPISERIAEFPKLLLVVTGFYTVMCVTKVRWWLSPTPFLPLESPDQDAPPESWCTAAATTTAETFIARRLENRRVKRQGVTWDVLFEDDDWVYYGQPRTVFGPGGLRSFSMWGVTEWYKTDKRALTEQMPCFRTLDGLVVESAIASAAEASRLGLVDTRGCRHVVREQTLMVFFDDQDEVEHTLRFCLETGTLLSLHARG